MTNPVHLHEMAKAGSQIGATLKQWRTDLRPKMTQAQVASAIDVDVMTVSRWERGAVKGMKTENAVALARIYQRPVGEVLSLLGMQAYGDANMPSDEAEHSVDTVRRLATRFNIRRAQQATAPELVRLRRELVLAVRNGLEAAGGRDPHFIEIVEAMVDLLTSESRPPKDESAAPTVKKSRTGTEH